MALDSVGNTKKIKLMMTKKKLGEMK